MMETFSFGYLKEVGTLMHHGLIRKRLYPKRLYIRLLEHGWEGHEQNFEIEPHRIFLGILHVE